MANKRLVLAVGGTGGHIYPALGLAHGLRRQDPALSIRFIGGGLSTNRYCAESQFTCTEVVCGTISLKKPFRMPVNAVRIARGIRQSYRFLREYRPSFVIGFGSYYSLPVLISAKLANIPIVLHEQNSIPGRVNRALSKYAVLTGVFFPGVQDRLKGRCVEVAMPLREGFFLGVHSREGAKRYFGLDPKKPVVLVFGGSQGARKINRLLLEGASGLDGAGIQLLQFTGHAEDTKRLSARYRECGVRSCVKDYERRMELAWSAADLVVSRAGAGSIAEQIEFEVPGILIPYPFALDDHQEYNADFMEKEVKGAIKRREQTLTSEQLVQEMVGMITGDALYQMRQRIQEYKAQRQIRDFSTVIREML